MDQYFQFTTANEKYLLVKRKIGAQIKNYT
jgi:hypothetical protein